MQVTSRLLQGHTCSKAIYTSMTHDLTILFRATAFDFCKVKRGKDGGTLRTMTAEKLLKTLPVLQAQVRRDSNSSWRGILIQVEIFA